MFNENLTLKGTLQLVLRDEYGNIKLDVLEENRVVDAGLAHIASRLKDATAGVMTHMAVGTSNANDNDTQTALTTEVARVAFDSAPTLVTTNVSNDSIQFVATFPAGTGTGALVEAGVLNNSTGGTMLCRTIFSVINKGALDSLTITWKVIVA
jgi:hypothetical protein